MKKEYDDLKEIGGTVIKIDAENSGSLNFIQQETVLEKEEKGRGMSKYRVEEYHHGAAMGQKNVKVCRDLQQLGNEKPVNTTVCRDFQRFSIPALGIFVLSVILLKPPEGGFYYFIMKYYRSIVSGVLERAVSEMHRFRFGQHMQRLQQ